MQSGFGPSGRRGKLWKGDGGKCMISKGYLVQIRVSGNKSCLQE